MAKNLGVTWRRRTVPIEIFELAFREKLIPSLRCYYCLNMVTDSYANWKDAIKLLIFHLSISRNTAKTHLRKLIMRGWFGQDIESKVIYIRSIHFIRRREDLLNRGGVRMYLCDLKKFREFAFAALLTKSIKVLRLRENKLGKQKEVPYQRLITLSHFPIALDLIMQRYGISKSTASRLRTNSMKTGYLNCKSSFRLEKRIKPESVPSIRRYRPDYGRRLRVRHGKVYIQLPTRVMSLLEFRRVKRIEKVSKCGNSGKEV